MGAEGVFRVCRGAAVVGGLGSTMNCGVEGVEGTEGVVGMEKDEEVPLAASKVIK